MVESEKAAGDAHCTNPFPPNMGKKDTASSPKQEEIPKSHKGTTKEFFKKYVLRWISYSIQLIDTHNGLVTAAATAAIAALTWSIAEDSQKQAQTAQAQFKIMRSQLDVMEADQRPWVGGPIEIKSITHDDGGVIFTHIYRNVGRTPTKTFYVDGKIIEYSRTWENVVIQLCESSIERTKATRFAIIPGGDWPLDMASMPSMLEEKPISISNLRKMKEPIIIGCVLYTSYLDNLVHTTGFMAAIRIGEKGVSVPFVYSVQPN